MNQVSSEFLGTEVKKGDSQGLMFSIARNDRTEPRGDIEEVLKRRAELYGDNLDPKWFNYKSDLGIKAKSTHDRNNARAMLAAAPLMIAQQGALKLSSIDPESCSSPLEFSESFFSISRVSRGRLRFFFPQGILRKVETSASTMIWNALALATGFSAVHLLLCS